MIKRWTAALLLAALALPMTGASAEPISTWEIYPGYECTSDPFNPILEDGTRDPEGDPAPGTPEWDERDAQHVACTDQRDHDARYNPMRNVGTALYGEDMYRQPIRHDDVRFRFDSFTQLDVPDVPSLEVYRPCAEGTCAGMPEGLQTFQPPYPVVLVFHGFIAQKSHHRFNAQVFAEHGYMAIAVNGTHIVGSAPNVQRTENGDDVLNWLASEASGAFGQEADLDRVAFTGHSQGGGVSLSYQNDPRVHAIIAWDAGDSVSDNNCTVDTETSELRPCAPIMYQRTDGGFATPAARTEYPEDRARGLTTYSEHKARGMDVFHFTARATVHTDWNGYGVGLAGNRYAELLINYYNLGWLDRHLRGKLAFDGNGDVITYDDRDEAAERAFRQDIANDAFERLTARLFDDSADVHNISLGFWDPELAVTSGDPLFGGNVPVTVEGLETRDRFSPYFYHYCSVSVPDYVNGSDGTPGSPAARRADTGPDGDMRFIGCPES
ncbi:MAG TPA: hypothetical protein VGB52_09600 [Actinomycetota bacterium]